MKKIIPFLTGLAYFAAVYSFSAEAAEKVAATLTVGTGAATSTASPTSGSVTWLKGAIVLMQCDVDVYWSAETATGTTTVTAATSSSQRTNFTSNGDPIIIYLDNNDQNVSVISVSASGTCKFITTQFRRKP